MTTRNVALYRLLGSLLLLIGFTLSAYAQEDLQIASLFEKYGKQKDVTYVELNGSILRSYRMTAYRSLVFKDVTPYKADIVQCLKQDVAGQQVTKTQEITESGIVVDEDATLGFLKAEMNGATQISQVGGGVGLEAREVDRLLALDEAAQEGAFSDAPGPQYDQKFKGIRLEMFFESFELTGATDKRHGGLSNAGKNSLS